MNLTDDELQYRLGNNPEVGADDREKVRCDNCGAEKSRKVVTRHRKKPYGYSMCADCLKRLGILW